MVDTFEIPSACICNYKASFGFGFRKAQSYPSFSRRRPAPLKEVECSNGSEISQSLKNRFLNLPASPHKSNDNVKFPNDDRNAYLFILHVLAISQRHNNKKFADTSSFY